MLPADVCRCMGIRDEVRCPLRLECARYVQRFDDDAPQFLVAQHLCEDESHSMRIPREDVA